MVFPYVNMNRPQVYIWPSILNPSHIPPHPNPLGFYRSPVLGALHHTSNLHWLPILHMVMYVFQCYSLKPSHPLLLPKPRKDLEVTSLWI